MFILHYRTGPSWSWSYDCRIFKLIHCPNGGEASEKGINLWLVGWFGWIMVFNATFNNICGGQLYWWRKPEYPKKSTSYWKTLSHNAVSSTLPYERGSNS
jgi:hypothetical protein